MTNEQLAVLLFQFERQLNGYTADLDLGLRALPKELGEPLMRHVLDFQGLASSLDLAMHVLRTAPK